MPSLNSFRAVAGVAANVDEAVYQVPAGKSFANVQFNILNFGDDPVTITIAPTTSSSIPPQSCLENGKTLVKNGVLRRSGLIMSPGEKLLIRGNLATLAIRVWGLEQNP